MINIGTIGRIGRTYRHINRYRQILGILIRHGFGDILEKIRWDQYVETALRMVSGKESERVERLSRAERIRMALEELGPTYIKLGQLLSIRSDLIPANYIWELSKLQDKVNPFPYQDIRDVLHAEFNEPLESLFDEFQEEPIASASIGQVHKARLKTGESVAVKVQRPGIRRIIEVDLDIMIHLATLMEKYIPDIALHRPVKIVEEFERIIVKEIDFTNELRNIERFSRQFHEDPTLYVPIVYREITTDRVLTMEFIDGIKITEIAQLIGCGLDRKLINARGADLFLKQIFDYGFFHADPHPGNIFVLPENVICLLDFGIVGFIDRNTREHFIDLIRSTIQRDETRTAQVLLKLTTWEEEPDSRLLERDIAEFMGHHLYKPVKEIRINKIIQDLFAITSRYKLRIPPDIFFMMKAFGTVEGIALMLNPEFDLITQAVPFVERSMLARLSPQKIAGEIIRIGEELMHFIRQFPKDALEISRMIRQKKISLKFELVEMDALLNTHERISNKLSFSIIIAALIIGSALIVISKIPPMFCGISLIGIIVFFAAAMMGIWLIVAIIRKGGL